MQAQFQPCYHRAHSPGNAGLFRPTSIQPRKRKKIGFSSLTSREYEYENLYSNVVISKIKVPFCSSKMVGQIFTNVMLKGFCRFVPKIFMCRER